MEIGLETRIVAYEDPILGAVFHQKNIKQITDTGNTVFIHLLMGFPIKQYQAQLIERLKTWLQAVVNKRIQIEIDTKIEPHAGREGIACLPNVKNIVAVASGKGGVGKSTAALHLALALSAEGAKVGLLDADIYGPSQPMMLGTKGKRPALVNSLLQPIMQHGIQSMSIGYLVDQQAPLVWRGPMIGKAMQQMLHETEWRDLDYLIVDLPPGTGDIQLTLCQKIPVSGAVIVTTPQDLALIDVRRAYEMFAKLDVPILGVIENMSTYHCSNCGHEEKLFGEGGAQKIVDEYGVKLLGQVPLNIRIREMTDSGTLQANHDEANWFHAIALKTAASLAERQKSYSNLFPKVVVEQNKKQG